MSYTWAAMRRFTRLLFLLAAGLAATPAAAQIRLPPPPDPAQECRAAVEYMERTANIPSRLMAAIARIESGRRDGQGGVSPWPWTINVEGQGYTFDSKAAAIAAVREHQARGAKSIDVGCMQVNLMYHPDAFASLDEAFDPMANARYAAKFLNDLYGQTRDWARATALYHSATPELGDPYQRKVFAVLPDEQRRRLSPAGTLAGGGNVWSRNVWTHNVWNTHGPAWPNGSGIPRQPPIPAHGGYMLSNRAGNARVIAAPPGTPGRTLDAYRAAPVPLARVAGSRL
jgi:hypothetical protein